MMIDLLIVNPKAGPTVYGALAEGDLVAIEPPLWCRLLAGHARDQGWEVDILDAEALGLDPEETAGRIVALAPRLAAIVAYGHQPSASTQHMEGAGALARALARRHTPNIATVLVGGHPSALPERTLREELVDYVAVGEGQQTIAGLLGSKPLELVPGLAWRRGDTIRVNKPAPIEEDLRKLHGHTWDLLPMDRYRAHNWHCFEDISRRQPYASIYTSLGCPYKCLAGDTPVNTIHGNIPIRELAEQYGEQGVPVYTFNPSTREAFIADSIKVRKYGEAEQLVRVHFEDGTHIDCTPDHGFLQFKWGNGKSPAREWECQAKDLPPGAHVRALRSEINVAKNRTYLMWGRRAGRLRSRMIADYEAERKLARTEHVHHKNRDSRNDESGNLFHCASPKEHFALHPEIAERMREKNLGAANRGKQRSPESRQRYRESKLGAKNPNFKHGHTAGRSSRLEANHRVAWVEWLAEKRDVYCLTVPATGWFYANNVLVKNCTFCCINAPFASNRYRMRSPDDVVDEIEYLLDEHGVSTIKIADEMFVLNERHYTAICEGMISRGFADGLNIWAYARVDTVKPENLSLLRKAGIRWLALGIESASKLVRDGAQKKLKNADIIGTVRAIQQAGIHVIGNFMFGLRDDDRDTMRATLDLAIECLPDFANFYATMAYPGSALFGDARQKGWTLPATWGGYSQHGPESRPLDTEHLNGIEVLAFRDAAFHEFFAHPRYLSHVESKFGKGIKRHVQAMANCRLERKAISSDAFRPPGSAGDRPAQGDLHSGA